jgi:acyl-CoA synthetase (AMP-forming)/AMP-acid ligase II
MKFNASAWMSVPAERYPDRTCIVYKDRTLSYSDINERANRLAWGLINRGFVKGSRVACLQYNCNQSFELFLGMWKAGIVMVPLNTRDSVIQNIDILRDSEATALIFGSEFMDQMEQIRQTLPTIKSFICHGKHNGMFVDYESILAESDASEPNFDLDENDIYKIHYTSGTTGRPRGVMMTYRNRKEQIAHVFMNADRLISKDDVFLHVAPLTHAAGYYSTPFYLKGAKHVILDKFDTTALLETIEKEKVTCTLLVPTMIVMLLEDVHIKDYNLKSLKRIFYGTAPMPISKLKQAVSIFGNIFRQNYGLTEAVQPLTHLTPEEHTLSGKEEVVKRLGSAGTRALGLEVRIVDGNDVDVPVGQIGEIILRSPHISPGYLNLPEVTEDTYSGGWLHTGDLGYMDRCGYVFIVDRKKDMIISGGFNIYSREVEIFLDSHPAVLESAVIGAPDEKWGEVVKAFVVLKKDKDKPTDHELIDFCIKKGLTRYKAPKLVRFIDSLPKNENRKIIKKDLKRLQ